MLAEQISALNQIIAIIDQKATEFKAGYMRMPESKRFAQKKLILDLIGDAEKLGNAIRPAPTEVLEDIKRLGDQLTRVR